MIARTLFLALCATTPSMLSALDLPANARSTSQETTTDSVYFVPVAPFDGRGVPVFEMSGTVTRQAWRIQGTGLTPQQIVSQLRAQFIANEFEIVLDCTAARCGGFDFRFGIETLPAPNLFVNLQNYRFVTARLGSTEAPDAFRTILVSTTAGAAYIQSIDVVAPGVTLAPDKPAPEPEPDLRSPVVASIEPVPGNAPANLLSKGFYVLDGLTFETGATTLASGNDVTLDALAAFLKETSGLRIALVGHTDSVGSLEANIRISRQRARAVRQRLIDAYNIDPNRLEAEGMGYLAPRASNLTPEGRAFNRRVEAIALSLD